MLGGQKSYGEKRLEPFQTLADNTKAKKTLGWIPRGHLPTWIRKYKKTLGIDNNMHYRDAYNRCIENSEVYDEEGKFIPYSTIINTPQDHKALCSSRKTNSNVV